MTTATTKQDKIKEQQLAAKFLMGVVSKMPFTKDAIVAGGAARDWVRGEPATDIDIFLIGTTATNNQITEHMAAHGFPVKMASKFDKLELGAPEDPRYSEEGYVGNPDLKSVFDGYV